MLQSRRRRVVLGAAVAVALAGVVAAAWGVRPTEPTPTRLQSVAVGMTRDQVRNAVGAPPGDYPSGRDLFYRVGVRYGDEIWRCGESQSELHVWYDSSGRVADVVVYRPGGAVPERFIFRLRTHAEPAVTPDTAAR